MEQSRALDDARGNELGPRHRDDEDHARAAETARRARRRTVRGRRRRGGRARGARAAGPRAGLAHVRRARNPRAGRELRVG